MCVSFRDDWDQAEMLNNNRPISQFHCSLSFLIFLFVKTGSYFRFCVSTVYAGILCSYSQFSCQTQNYSVALQFQPRKPCSPPRQENGGFPEGVSTREGGQLILETGGKWCKISLPVPIPIWLQMEPFWGSGPHIWSKRGDNACMEMRQWCGSIISSPIPGWLHYIYSYIYLT